MVGKILPMKKLIGKYIILISSACFLFSFFSAKKERVFYLPFDIPGKQMAATIPPVGIFIEKKYKNEGDGCGTILAHEKIHWDQYKRMGLVLFHFEYMKGLIKNGRVYHHWMEVEARKKSKCGKLKKN